MGSTRQSTHLTPIKIFNDSFGTDQGSQSHNLSSPLDNAPSLQPGGNVLAPRSDMNGKVIPSAQAGRSPSKPGALTSSPPLKHALSNAPGVSFPTPKMGQTTDSLIKKPSPVSYQNMAAQLSQQSGPFMLPGAGNMDKENTFPSYSSSDNFAEFSGPSYIINGNRPTNKRPLEETPSSEDRASKAPRMIRIPEPHEMPEIVDDGRKPRYTYAQLVAMAILRSPNRKLMLASIYEWISNTFAFYREGTASGWQNSIRHNLSLHKAFKKVERPRNDPGKGHYWIIEPDRIVDFLDEKHSRRPASSSNSNRPSSRPSSSHGPQSQPQTIAPMQPPQQRPSSRQTMQPPPRQPLSSAQSLAKAHQAAEPSSDATIPLSDPALLEEDGEEAWVDIARQSSPQPPMHSSPPVPKARSRANTAAGNEPTSSSHRSKKKKKRASMNDSGYYSSLESSAMRRPQSRAGLDSLASARKRGRAEDEIARLRSSSQDVSPSKSGLYLGVPRNSTPGLLSSSPTRPLDQPLTPALDIKLGPRSAQSRKTKLAAPTLSPDTQLANHRNKVNELIGTPLKGLNGISEDVLGDFFTPQSQSFNILDETFDLANMSPNVKFNFFGDDHSPLKRRTLAGRSPEKLNSAMRPSLLRSCTTPGKALGDITKSVSNRPSPASLKPPVKFMSRLGSPLRFTSPEKAPVTAAANINSNEALTLTSSPFKKLFEDFKSPMKFASPYTRKLSEDVLDVDHGPMFDFSGTGNMFSLDLFADDDKIESPVEAQDQVLGLDLAGGFSKIGSEAVKDKENMVLPPKKIKSEGKKARPALGGRSSTSFI